MRSRSRWGSHRVARIDCGGDPRSRDNKLFSVTMSASTFCLATVAGIIDRTNQPRRRPDPGDEPEPLRIRDEQACIAWIHFQLIRASDQPASRPAGYPAVELFVTRLLSAQDTTCPIGDARAAEICRRSDGIPLAIDRPQRVSTPTPAWL